tara:strand:+ start:10662 stop:11702 length:1041 start_codon:yes stop_codon:yes gene_type:complete
MNKIDLLNKYSNARKNFIDWTNELSYIDPIEFGTLKAPGLSDLDLGVSFNNFSTEKIYDFKKHLKKFPKNVKEIMNGGTLMLFKNNDLININFIDDVKINFLNNKKNNLLEIDNSSLKIISLLQILEWIPERMGKIYNDLNRVNFNLKRLIGFFYSLHYSIKKSSEYVKLSNNALLYIKKINNCRVFFVENDKEKFNLEFEWLKENYINICTEIMIKISNYLDPFFASKKNESDIIFKLNDQLSLVSNKSLKQVGRIQNKNKIIYINVPSVFLFSYLHYSSRKFDLSKIIYGRFNNIGNYKFILKDNLKDDFQNLLDKRIYLMDSMFKFIKNNNFNFGLYKFGWYL